MVGKCSFQNLAFVLLLAGAASALGVRFPLAKASYSPDRQWHVVLHTDTTKDVGVHTLYLKKSSSADSTGIFAFDRGCDLLWNRNAEIAAITDWRGSNTSEIHLLDLRKVSHCQRLKELVPSLGSELSLSEAHGHLYWEAVSWKSAGELEIRAYGHTDEAPSHGFLFRYLVDIAHGNCRLIEQKTSSATVIEQQIRIERDLDDSLSRFGR